MSHLGEERFGKSVDVIVLVCDDSNCDKWCTAGIRYFDCSVTVGFAYLSVLLRFQKTEDLGLLGNQLLFPQFLKALAKEAEFVEVSNYLLNICARSNFRFYP